MFQVWDSNIIETTKDKLYDSNIDDFVDALQHNITVPLLISFNSLCFRKSDVFYYPLLLICKLQTQWANEVKKWETCSLNKTTCPDMYDPATQFSSYSEHY